MDEMEMYRDRIERRRGDRRLKNQRRHPETKQPKFFDPMTAIILAILTGFGILFGLNK